MNGGISGVSDIQTGFLAHLLYTKQDHRKQLLDALVYSARERLGMINVPDELAQAARDGYDGIILHRLGGYPIFADRNNEGCLELASAVCQKHPEIDPKYFLLFIIDSKVVCGLIHPSEDPSSLLHFSDHLVKKKKR